YKLKYGHRGGNQPVMNLLSGRVEITSQNHGFCVDFGSIGELDVESSGGLVFEASDIGAWVRAGVAPVVRSERYGRVQLTHVNLNDMTTEGIRLLDTPAFSVQYHPEAAPGPHDSRYLFDAFTRLMDGDADYLRA
ncbi:MAG: carbamoyl-phosphate synthase small subunit, partial [Actinobacteria bacterium]